MADLNQLMALEGAVAAFRMNDRGELQEHLLGEGAELNQTARSFTPGVASPPKISPMKIRSPLFWKTAEPALGFQKTPPVP